MKTVYIEITGAEFVHHTRTIVAQVPDNFADDDVPGLAETLNETVPLDARDWDYDDSDGIDVTGAFVSDVAPTIEEPDVVINDAGSVMSLWEEA